MKNIKLFNVTWATTTAGVSPDGNNRTEIFFKGCKKALQGNPCKGCFNPDMWDDTVEHDYSPQEVALRIKRFAPNRYITIGGGEPTDQFEPLIALVKDLKKQDFHIIVYTWKKLKTALSKNHKEKKLFEKLLKYIDILVDGPYDESQRLYKENQEDGFLNSVGSGNQVIWDIRDHIRTGNPLEGHFMKDLCGLCISSRDGDKNNLLYILKEKKEPIKIKEGKTYV